MISQECNNVPKTIRQCEMCGFDKIFIDNKLVEDCVCDNDMKMIFQQDLKIEVYWQNQTDF